MTYTNERHHLVKKILFAVASALFGKYMAKRRGEGNNTASRRR